LIGATLLGITQHMAGSFAARFVLEMADGGVFPGVVPYLSMWYRREEQHFWILLLAGAFEVRSPGYSAPLYFSAYS